MNKKKCEEQMLRQKDEIAQALTAMNIPYQYSDGELMYFDVRQSGVGFLSCFKQLIYISDHEEVVCDAIFPVRPPRKRAVYDRLLRVLNELNLGCSMEGAYYLLEYDTGDVILRVVKCCGENVLAQREYTDMIICALGEFCTHAQKLITAMWTTPLALQERDPIEAFQMDVEEGFEQEEFEEDEEIDKECEGSEEEEEDVLRFLVRSPRDHAQSRASFDIGDGARVEAELTKSVCAKKPKKKNKRKKHKKKKKLAWDEDSIPF